MSNQIAEIVQQNIDYLADKWLNAIKKPQEEKLVCEKEVIKVIYQILNGMCLVLVDKEKQSLFKPHGAAFNKAKILGELRRAQGYELEEVLGEYLILRKETWQLLRERLQYKNINVFELEERINFCLTNILKATIESFHHTHTKDLKEKAVTDPLTGLFNRRQFDKLIMQEVYRSVRYERPLTLILLDIDHFKDFNDEYGHPAGDVALVHLAAIIRQFLRVSDAAARYGGEEFALILPETTQEQGFRVAGRIRRAVERSQFYIQNKKKIGVTISIGLACFPNDCKDAKSLVQCSDEALYKAKHLGRNRVVCYSRQNSASRWFNGKRA